MAQQCAELDTTYSRRVRLNYLLHLPPEGVDAAPGRPMILFLHGKGERGSDLELLKSQGLPALLDGRPEFPFVVASPQCPGGENWVVHTDGLAALLDRCLHSYHVDPGRVYLTGLSMGGHGAWHLATLMPERFAALAPICGPRPDALKFKEIVCRLRDLAAWMFHGSDDPKVPVQDSIGLVSDLQECGGNVRLTVYPGVGHDSWTRTYANPELYDWFLRHRRGEV